MLNRWLTIWFVFSFYIYMGVNNLADSPTLIYRYDFIYALEKSDFATSYTVSIMLFIYHYLKSIYHYK